MEVITPGSLPDVVRGLAPQPVQNLASAAMYLQAGAFGVAANAEQLAGRLRAAGVAGVTIREPDAAVSLYRVRVGPVADVATFDLLAAQIARLGVGTVLVTE